MKLRAYLHTSSGGRERNEDCGAYRIRPWKYSVFAVADGLGGHGNGDVASSLAVEAVIDCFSQNPSLKPECIHDMMEKVNDTVCAAQGKENGFYSMKTTLAAALYRHGKIAFSHVGDTRIYLFRKNKCIYRTRDHSLMQLAVEAGRISDDQLAHHPDRNQLIRAIGGGVHKPDISTAVQMRRGDAILICTDGFWEFVDEQYMEDTLSICETPSKWVSLMLSRHAKQCGACVDNHTALAVFAL